MTTQTKSFRLSRLKLIPSLVVALFCLTALAAPGRLSKLGALTWIEREGADGKETAELLKIYSIIKKRMTGGTDASVWSLSQTIQRESRRHGLDPLLVLAIITVESGFQHTAAAADGARGLMQIQPESARDIAEQRRSVYANDKHLDDAEPDLDNPIVNVKLGVFYLHSLQQSFQDLSLALAAYNRGPARLKSDLAEESGAPLEYAARVLGTYHGYRRGARRSD